MWLYVPLDGPIYVQLRLDIYGSQSDAAKLTAWIAGELEHLEQEIPCKHRWPRGAVGPPYGCLHGACETQLLSILLSRIFHKLENNCSDDDTGTLLIVGMKLKTGSELQRSSLVKAKVTTSTNTSSFEETEIGSVTKSGKEIGRVLLRTPPPISICSPFGVPVGA